MNDAKLLSINEIDSKNIKKYKKVINKCLKINDDNEQSHILQDKIYRQFIKDITKNSLTQTEIQQIALIIKNNVVVNDIGRWYA